MAASLELTAVLADLAVVQVDLMVAQAASSHPGPNALLRSSGVIGAVVHASSHRAARPIRAGREAVPRVQSVKLP